MSRRTTQLALHRARCRDSDCTFCEHIAEERAHDIEPDFDESAAATSYERSIGYV